MVARGCVCWGASGAGECKFTWHFQGCGGAYGLRPKSRTQHTHAPLPFKVYPAGKLSVTLYLWFRLSFVDGLAVLTELLIVTVGTMGSF